MSSQQVTVTTTDPLLRAARDQAMTALGAESVGSRLAAGTATLWGADATPEASVRLGWLTLAQRSTDLLAPLAGLRAELLAEGLDRVVLAGMGGSSLAPEVIARTAGVPLTVLDTTDPGAVARALEGPLDRTVLVVSSKSGGTVETDSQHRAFRAAFGAVGVDPARRIVVVTDPGSPLEQAARRQGARAVFLADPDVGGRYSALSAFGLVPSALAGADVAALLAQAREQQEALGRDDERNPGLLLGAALGGGCLAGKDKLILADAGSGLAGFGDWAEQLVAESTGKQGRGLLPVVIEGTGAPGFSPAADSHPLALGASELAATSVDGPLGAQFLVWEYATAVAGRLLGINPFDQPNVAESKDNTAELLRAAAGGPLPDGEPVLVDGPVAVYDEGGLLGAAGSAGLEAALAALLAAVPERGYVAVMAYLDRAEQAEAAQLRPALAERLAHPVTFGWGPRFLHSTGQYHKGGPQLGVFLQLTGEPSTDVAIPGREFGFARLQRAQALGDLRALVGRGRPALRLHLTERAAGLQRLQAAIGRLQ